MNNNDIKCKIIEEELKSVWPEWHVAGHLGGGSFGDVFQIYRDNFGIRVDAALKVIQVSDKMTTEEQDESCSDIPDAFRSEIQIMEILRGAPNIVVIEDFYFKKDGETSSLFVRMELLTSLQEVLSNRDGQHTLSSIREICKLGRDVCTALMHCEEKGIIHRDIKPANLFVDGFSHYKVGDFGASKRMETVHIAQTMTSIGTISYMAPEIFRGKHYNNTVDIYALGLVLYQLLNNGRIPFLPSEGSYTTQDIDSANYKRLHGTPLPDLTGKTVGGERIDSQLDAVLRKAFAMNPADRYQTAKEFYDALMLYETPEKKSAQEESASEKRTQGSLAPAGSLQNLQQEKEHSGQKTKQQATPSPDRISQRQPQKEWLSSGKKPVIVIVILLILCVAALIFLQSRRKYSGSYASTDLGDNEQTEEINESGTEEDTISADEDVEIVEIPDPVLKKAIQDTLRIGDQEITRKDALSLTVLVYEGYEYGKGYKKDLVKDITGLSAFKNLTKLDLYDNQLSDISTLSGLTNLTELDLRSNKLSDISALSGLTNLKELELSCNQLRDISALSGLTNLTTLDLEWNQLGDISALSGLTNLTELDLSHNQLSYIGVLSDLTNLTKLDLAFNQLRNISALSGLTNLTELDLCNNQLSNIYALSRLTNLTFLNLHCDTLSDINALSGLTNLNRLILSTNQLSDISALSGLTNLTSLDLESNQLSDISALSGLTNLTSLDLDDNQISDISALSRLTNLTLLCLADNPIVKEKSKREIYKILSGAENLTVCY